MAVHDGPARIVIRDMTRADLDRAGSILFHAFNGAAEKHGYAPRMLTPQEGTAWAWTILRHGPHELLVAEADGCVAGVCCLHPRGEHGGIGPVAVDPAAQGKRIGRTMVDALLGRTAGLQSVRLFQEAYNPASFSLYYALDFLPVADLLDLIADPVNRRLTTVCSHVQELSMQDLDEVVAYDRPRSRYERRADLAYYLQWGKVLVYRQGSQVRGVLACLPGARSVQLGPLVAESEEEARCLFQHALAIYHDRQCQTRVMVRDRALVGYLHEQGFRIYCLNMLMVRGSWRPDRYIEAFGRFPEGT